MGEAQPSDRTAKAVWSAFVVLGMLLAGFLAFLITRRNWNFSPVLDGWAVVAFELIASGLCLARGIGHGRHGRVALIMGAACLSWTVGDLVFTIESLNGGTPPTPSLADLFYLGFFPFAFVAILLYTRQEIKRGEQANWLDGAIAALGMAALCSGVAFHGLERLVEGSSLASATTLAYPVCDLVLLGIVAGSSVVVSGRSRSTLVLLAVGMAINATGDTFNFVASTSTLGQIVNGIAWPTSILVFAMSMWVGDGGSSRLMLRSLSGFVLPGFVTCSSLVILVIGNEYHLGPLAVALATITLILTGIRLAFRPALRQARERLRSSEDRYQMLFEQNPEPLAAYDRHTLQIVTVSDAMVTKYGYSRDELATMTVLDLVPEEDVDAVRAYLSAHPDGGRPTDAGASGGYPGRHRLRDGSIIDVEISSNNIDLDGRPCRLALFDDVTERSRNARELAVARDRAVEASNMKSAFLANMSHEIRTPMNGVIGMTDLLLTSELTGEQRGFAEQVSRSGEQMLTLINDILDISKLETGHIELDINDFNLHETIQQTCTVAAIQAREKGLRFELEIEPEVPQRTRGDARRMQQVLLNLVSNAVKFTGEGAVGVRVSSRAQSESVTRIAIAVSDTGIGIDPAGLERMFEPFTQADVSTTRLYGGTGLGLAIVRELVELMGGSIRAESELGQGSVFWFEFELDAALSAETPPAAHANGAANPTPSWTTPPLVLVAEDSPVNQIVATRALERWGCRTEVVGNGREALRALDDRRYDAVMMDCQMPGLDGYAATAELRRREGSARHTPVIAMTAHAMDGDRERCLAAGMDDYISKPMGHAALAEVLMRWIPQDAARNGIGADQAPRMAASG
jgi:PAS domain S-box-containing protein